MRIRIQPPTNSAFFSYFAPKIFPILTPTIESVNVITPMISTAMKTATPSLSQDSSTAPKGSNSISDEISVDRKV